MLLCCHKDQAVQMRLQLSDVCGEGRVVAGASRYEKNRLRCTAASMMWTRKLMIHLRRGSYLLAPTTIDPSRTNNTASSRFQMQYSIATRLQTRLQAPRVP